MRRLILAFWCTLCISSPSWAADFRSAAIAYNDGDYLTALQDFTVLAGEGHVDAQYYLAGMFEQGIGVPQDLGNAATWYRKAAEQGKAEAMLKMGQFYEQGVGVSPDPVSAVGWYQRAANEGVAEAQYRLGIAYGEGNGIPQNDKSSKMWLERAAEQGIADAQFRLGDMLFALSFPPKDNTEAYKWMSLAAHFEHKDAPKELRYYRIFMFSEQITKGEEAALKWRQAFESRTNDHPAADQ